MLWTAKSRYHEEPFELEADLEDAVRTVSAELFGPDRLYLDVKKKIGAKGKTVNVPDAYLLDLSSSKQPIAWVVENELAAHHPLKHVAVQILEMSLSFVSTPMKAKAAVKGALSAEPEAWAACEAYAKENGFGNVDYLLERAVHGGGFGAVVVIDELSEELETALVDRFKFPVEVLTLTRYRNAEGERAYAFRPFREGLDAGLGGEGSGDGGGTVDPLEVDTIVVPARDEGFQETALGEDRWYKIRMSASMIPKIKHLAVYRVSPISAVTHLAEVQGIAPWEDSGKYVVNFAGPIKELEKPIGLAPKGKVKAPMAPRYTSYERLVKAKTLDEAF